MDAPQARRSEHRLRVPLVTNDFVVEPDLFEKPQDALRARIVEVMDFDQRQRIPGVIIAATADHSTPAGSARAILSPRVARITQPNVTRRPMTSGRWTMSIAAPNPLIAAAAPMAIPT